MYQVVHAFLAPHLVFAVWLQQPARNHKFLAQLIRAQGAQLVKQRPEFPISLREWLNLGFQSFCEMVLYHLDEHFMPRFGGCQAILVYVSLALLLSY